MYVTRYQWVFDPFFGWQLRPVQVFVGYAYYTPVYGYWLNGYYYGY